VRLRFFVKKITPNRRREVVQNHVHTVLVVDRAFQLEGLGLRQALYPTHNLANLIQTSLRLVQAVKNTVAPKHFAQIFRAALNPSRLAKRKLVVLKGERGFVRS
jgi:hypothetical protein